MLKDFTAAPFAAPFHCVVISTGEYHQFHFLTPHLRLSLNPSPPEALTSMQFRGQPTNMDRFSKGARSFEDPEASLVIYSDGASAGLNSQVSAHPRNRC